MQHSTSGSTDTVTATTPLAMYAVAQHMLDRQLPSPNSIEAPAWKSPAVRVLVSRPALDEWLDSMLVDDESSHPLREGSAWIVTEYTGRVPSPVGDVAVVVKVVDRYVRPLVSVQGGAA